MSVPLPFPCTVDFVVIPLVSHLRPARGLRHMGAIPAREIAVVGRHAIGCLRAYPIGFPAIVGFPMIARVMPVPVARTVPAC